MMTPTKSVLLLAASGLALTLGGCKVDNRPLLARFGGPPPPAPAYAALPQPGLPDIDGGPAYPVGDLPPAKAYPYAERAYAMDRIVYQAPPAYGFAYDGVQPWAWQAADDGLMFAEPYGDDYRFYYYEPGATYPYFVRDDSYGYAYGPDGGLLALFDAAGALIAADQYGRYYPEARGYWSRGYDLHRAYGSGGRYPVDRAVWAERAPRLRQVEQSWIDAPQRQPAWRDWRASQGQRFARSEPQLQTDHFGADRGRHEGWARQGRGAQFAAAPMPGGRDQALHGGSGSGRGHDARGPQDQGHGRRTGQGPGGQGQHFAAAASPQGGGWQGGGHGGGHRGGPQAQFQAQPQPQRPGGHGGGGHGGGHAGGGGPPAQVAQGQPQPQWQGGGHGGGHGGEHGGQAQPQPQGRGGGQGGGQGGGHGGGGNGGGNGHGGGAGHADKHGR
jgi:hypothetical protein